MSRKGPLKVGKGLLASGHGQSFTTGAGCFLSSIEVRNRVRSNFHSRYRWYVISNSCKTGGNSKNCKIDKKPFYEHNSVRTIINFDLRTPILYGEMSALSTSLSLLMHYRHGPRRAGLTFRESK